MKKEQIIARFRALFPAVKLSTTRLNALAAALEAKDLQDEAAIDAQLHAANEIIPFEELYATDNTIANLKHQLKTAGKPAPKEGDDNPAGQQPPADNESPTDKLLKTLLSEVQALKADKAKATMQEKLSANEKLKTIPKAFYKGRPIPEKDEDIEAFVNEVEADYKEVTTHLGVVQQDATNATFSTAPKPAASAGSGGKTIDPSITAYAAKKHAQSSQTKKE